MRIFSIFLQSCLGGQGAEKYALLFDALSDGPPFGANGRGPGREGLYPAQLLVLVLSCNFYVFFFSHIGGFAPACYFYLALAGDALSWALCAKEYFIPRYISEKWRKIFCTPPWLMGQPHNIIIPR
jgi:hypothetical protein